VRVGRVQRILVILAASMVPIGMIMFTLRALGSSSLWTAIGCNGAFFILAILACAAYMLSCRDSMRSYRDKIRSRSNQRQ
jgi:hypothetical protein